MYYYIDGYNLLFRLLYSGKDFSIKRQQLIEELSEKLKALEVDATIIFDSQYRQEEGTRSHYKHLEIIFTSPGETADERIIEEVQAEKQPNQVTVVTSDKKLAWFARRCHAGTESAEEFLDWVNKRYKNKQRQKYQQAKKEPEQKVKVVPAKKVAEPIKTAPPPVEKPAEGGFNYYLTSFQTRFEQLEEKRKPKKDEANKRRPTPKKLKIPKSEIEEERSFSEIDRWIRIFEKKLSENGV
jgi:predicted RNA-binding protein with PIN domain